MTIKSSFIAFALVAATATAQETLTLQQAMRRALASNPQTQSARVEVEAAEAQQRFYRSAILPQIEFSGSHTTNAEEVSLDFEGQKVSIIPQNDYYYEFRLSQPLFAGGRELKTIRQSGLAIESAKAGARKAEDQILLETAAAYLGALEGEDLVAVEKSSVELAERRRKQARDFFEAGEVTQVDVLRADTAVKAAERRLAAATQTRDVGFSRLRVAAAVDGPIDIETPRLALPDIPSEDALLARAQTNRPEVRQAAFSRRVADIEVSKQRAFRLPTVRAEASARTQRADFPSDQMGALSVNVSFPIFDSGAIGSRVALAAERRKQAELNVEQAERQVREDVRQALITLRSAETNLALAKEQLAAAEAEYTQAFELYRAQEATSLDVASAENTLADARRAVVTGTLDRDLSELRVWYATGSLADVLIGEEK